MSGSESWPINKAQRGNCDVVVYMPARECPTRDPKSGCIDMSNVPCVLLTGFFFAECSYLNMLTRSSKAQNLDQQRFLSLPLPHSRFTLHSACVVPQVSFPCAPAGLNQLYMSGSESWPVNKAQHGNRHVVVYTSTLLSYTLVVYAA